MISPDFEKVGIVFDKILKQQAPYSGAQVAVYHHGKLVVDLAGSRPASDIITSETSFLNFSVSKAFTAAAIWRLMEEGKLDLDAPIGKYWPEFASRGKEEATIRHALLHQAGVPAPHLRMQVLLWPYWGWVTRGLAREKAQFKPGTQTAYHLVNFGFILGEVVRRVSGQPIDVYLQQNFFEPMGLKNTWMRIPTEALPRSPRLLAGSDKMKTTVHIFNRPMIRCALIPAAGLHSNAVGTATFFQMLLNGGEYAGKRYLKPETIDLAAKSHYDGYDSYIKFNMNWGLGLIMGGGAHQPPNRRDRVMGYGSTSTTFGALGLGTCMVWADRRAELVAGFTCNNMLSEPEVNQRWSAISNAVWDCIPD